MASNLIPLLWSQRTPSAPGPTHILSLLAAIVTTSLVACGGTQPEQQPAVASNEQQSGGASNALPPPLAADAEVAVLAGGCFWGMEEILRKIPGVLDTEVGYTGGKTANPTYEDLHDGTTGHAESVRIVFDPKKLSYADLLESWFFRMHDPTTANRQGNDVGSQYRSVIFATTPVQLQTAIAVRAKVDASGRWDKPIVTEIVEAGTWTRAEDYHQDYLEKNPDGYTCHYLR